ncbi:MAG: glycosyltransferase family 2 protein [Saprospiraceae bacterium]
MAFPLVSIVTVNYRAPEVTCELLDSLRTLTYPQVEVWVVDNGAEEDVSALFEQHYPGVNILVSSDNLGFAGGNNWAMRQAAGAFVLLVNNDTIVPPGLLEPMVETLMNHPEAGIVSPKLYYFDAPNTLQYAGTVTLDLYTGRGKYEARYQQDHGQFDTPCETDFAHGACMMIRRELMQAIGLLPEDYFMYYEELDYCLRARRAGWRIRYTPSTYLHHKESMAMGKASPLKTYYMFRNRWLLVKRYGNWQQRLVFMLYFLGFGWPLGIMRHVWKREWQHARAVWRALTWHLGLGKG